MGIGVVSDLPGQGYHTSSCSVNCSSRVIINRVDLFLKCHSEERLIVFLGIVPM